MPSPLKSLRLFTTALLLSALPLFGQMNEGETTADAAVPGNKAMATVKETPGLPRVLLIGDSISIGYTLPVRELLQGKAMSSTSPAMG